MNTPIFDVHVHAGNFVHLRDDIQGLLTNYPFEDGISVSDIFTNPSSLQQYLKNQGVVRAVILAECGPGTNFSIDSDLILDFCKNNDFFIPFGSINPQFHKDPLGEWQKDWKNGVKGYKFYPADHDFFPFSEEMMGVYAKCEEVGQPIMFHTGLTAQKDTEQKYIRPDEYTILADRFPNLTLIFAHGGKPTWYDQALTMASEYENVYLDTALVPAGDVVEWIKFSEILEDKIFFASDLPVSGAYSRVQESYLNIGFGETALRKIMHDNASRVIGHAFSKLAASNS